MNSKDNKKISFKDALERLEKEKRIDRSQILDAIKVSLENAYRSYFIRQANIAGDKFFASVLKKDKDFIKVIIDEDTYESEIFLAKEVIPDDLEIVSPLTEIHMSDAREIDENCEEGDEVYVEAPSDIDLGNIEVQNSKGLIIQKLRELEKNSLFVEYKNKEGKVVSGVVSRKFKNNYNINLGHSDAVLLDQDRIKNEKLEIGETIKVYVKEVEESSKGPKIRVSRNDPMLVVKLFEQEVSEIRDGLVEIKSIAREAGSRTKIAVYSYDKDIDAVGSFLGVNSIRVNSVVEELHGEKIDIVNWDQDISNFVENALSPAKSIIIAADEDNKAALVVVPDSQLSLAIGKEGQNARLAAKLTNYKIDIKSETQAVEQGIYDRLGVDYDRSKYKVSQNTDTAKESEVTEENEEVKE